MDPQLTIALAGNPNSGKTTAFNALTGSHQHVGNYPGITVEKKEGFIKMPSGRCVRFIDLPGTYSLTAYTQEETVARHVLAQERPDVVIDVLNAGAAGAQPLPDHPASGTRRSRGAGPEHDG